MSWAPVLSKPDFVRRYKAGEFGNASISWESIEDYLRDRYVELVHVRNRARSSDSFYNQTRRDVYHRSYPDGDWYVSAMAPHDIGTIQGEVYRAPEGLRLTYTFVKKPMRDALKEDLREAVGLKSTALLWTYMNQRSYEWTMELLNRYDGHVIEFSCFNRCWGTVPGYNTVFWEVRNY